jgi:hypothetical protein
LYYLRSYAARHHRLTAGGAVERWNSRIGVVATAVFAIIAATMHLTVARFL